MKICLVGGIFDRDAATRSKHVITPETVLLDGYQRTGVDVHAVGHAKFLPSDGYDIIHIHHLGRAALKMAAASSCRAHFVFTGHNGMIVTGYERSWLQKRAFRYVIDKADALVALSQAEANYFAGVGVGHKAHVIPNGIPADVFHTNPQRQQGSDTPTLLYVGQLIELKGINFLLQAFQRLRQKCNARLRLVYHNAQLEGALKQQAQELGIAEHVDFVGILGPAELTQEYQRADVFVLPSLAECLPSVITEAFLCGTPVVASAVCGIPEQVDKFGLVVPAGDVGALANALESVLSDLPRHHALAAERRAYAATRFDPQTMVASHLGLYQQLLANAPGRRNNWLDPLVRLAIKAYWARSQRAAS